jgi:hypothetical protein
MASPAPAADVKQGNGKHESGPNFFQKLTNSSAFDKVRNEAGNIGDAAVQELSKVAKTVVLPALMTSLRNFIGDHLPNAESKQPSYQDTKKSSYQPSLDRNAS